MARNKGQFSISQTVRFCEEADRRLDFIRSGESYAPKLLIPGTDAAAAFFSQRLNLTPQFIQKAFNGRERELCDIVYCFELMENRVMPKLTAQKDSASSFIRSICQGALSAGELANKIDQEYDTSSVRSIFARAQRDPDREYREIIERLPGERVAHERQSRRVLDELSGIEGEWSRHRDELFSHVRDVCYQYSCSWRLGR